MKASSAWRVLDIKIIFFFVIDFLKAVAVVLESIVNKSIDCFIILNDQDEYFQLRYLPKGLIQAWVLRDKLDETSKSELNVLLWLIEVSSLILD